MAHEMFAQVGLAATLQTVVDLARHTFGCDAAGVLLHSDAGVLQAASATGQAAAAADALQLEHHQGPALQALARRQPVIIDEVRFDSRWRFWAPLAADLGFRSSLSLSLLDGDTAGALTLYSRRASFFDADGLQLGQAFAQHAAIAVAISRERGQLLRAGRARGVVGQAQGLLMERFDISAERAHGILHESAEHRHVTVEAVAEQNLRGRRFVDFGVLVEALAVRASDASSRLLGSIGSPALPAS